MIHSIRTTGITTLLALASAAPAASTPEPDPQVYMQAFNDTCRRGFPDLDAIAANATAQGWQVSEMRLISGPSKTLPEGLPRAYHKDGLMLFLTLPTAGASQQVCQISGSAQTRLKGADVATTVSASLNANAPVPDKSGDDDMLVWTVAPGMTVKAGISVYRKSRTISISVMRARAG